MRRVHEGKACHRPDLRVARASRDDRSSGFFTVQPLELRSSFGVMKSRMGIVREHARPNRPRCGVGNGYRLRAAGFRGRQGSGHGAEASSQSVRRGCFRWLDWMSLMIISCPESMTPKNDAGSRFRLDSDAAGVGQAGAASGCPASAVGWPYNFRRSGAEAFGRSPS